MLANIVNSFVRKKVYLLLTYDKTKKSRMKIKASIG